MSEMVERVARAIANNLGPLGDLRYYMSDEEAMSAARAAIEAMREPTDAMWDAGPVINDPNDYGPQDVWDAMINAALADPPPVLPKVGSFDG